MKIDGKEYVEIRVDETKYETDDAVLFEIDGEDVWLPKSQLEDWPDMGDDGDILITEWLANERGMI